MKYTLVILIICLIKITDAQTPKANHFITLNPEIYHGVNTFSDIYKKHIKDTTFLTDAIGFTLSYKIARQRFRLRLSSGLNIFNITEENILSIPVRSDFTYYLSSRFALKGSLGLRYISRYQEQNNSTYFEWGVGASFNIFKNKPFPISICLKRFNQENFVYMTFPIYIKRLK